jgi:ribosomal protein S18 acetylase RimI-like enzyme
VIKPASNATVVRVRPACPEELPDFTRIVAEAFNSKMNLLYGRNPERVQKILGAMYRGPLEHGYDGLLIAEIAGQVVGTLAVEPMPWYAEDANLVEYLTKTELGAWRRWWNRTGFAVFAHGASFGDAYLTDIGVTKSARGQGVGKALMQHAETWAIVHNRQALTLWVAANNQVARHLYSRAGMVETHSEFNAPSGLLFGVWRWVHMRKNLSSSADRK